MTDRATVLNNFFLINNDELLGVSIYTRLSNKRLKLKCKKERIRRELGKHYVESKN